MRVALHNPFGAERPTAERELGRRMIIAGERKGWTIRAVHSTEDISAFQPDLVVSLHHEAPKATPYPTLGCLWNPPAQYEDDPATLARVLSYDGFLTAGPSMEQFVAAHFHPTHRAAPMGTIYPATHSTALPPRVGADSRLFYVGSNWDGRRFERLFRRLAEAGVLAAHGPPDGWDYLGEAYAGPIPFDGQAVLETANRCGIGLCLHLPGHTASGLPNMRVFELAAAGALMVCGRHPFIEEHFADAVLTVDPDAPSADVAAQITAHVRWARANPQAANAMAARAQATFLDLFTLDRSMDAWPALAAAARAGCCFGAPADDSEAVQFVLPLSEGNPDALRRVIDGVAAQGHRAAGLIVAGPISALEAASGLIAAAPLKVRTVPVSDGAPGSAALWAALRMVDAPWFGVVDAGTTLFSNHAAALLDLAVRAEAKLVFSHAVTSKDGAWRMKPDDALRRGELPGDRLDIPSPAFLARKELLDARLLRDPGTGTATAPRYLVRRLAARTEPVSSWIVTLRVDDAVLSDADRLDMKRLERLDPTTPPPPGGARRQALPAPPSGIGAAILADVPVIQEAADFAQLAQGRPVYIYGASRGGRLVQLELMKHPSARIAGFLDSYATGSVWDLPIHKPADLRPEALADALIVVASQHVAEIVEDLKRMGPLSMFNAYPYIAAQAIPR